MTDMMDNFTPGSLEKFLAQKRAESGGSSGALTARGQRIADLLQVKTPGQDLNKKAAEKPQTNNRDSMDSLIRKYMGEMVRQYVQARKLNELKEIMLEHRCFIDEILQLVENAQVPPK